MVGGVAMGAEELFRVAREKSALKASIRGAGAAVELLVAEAKSENSASAAGAA